MFRIRLPSGVEMMFPSPEDFQAAVSGGVVTSDSEIFHQKAERWVPIASHPTYHRAVSAAKNAAAMQAVAAPARRVAPTVPPSAPRVAMGGSAAEVTIPQTAPRPVIAPPAAASAQRPRLVLEKPAPAAGAPPVAVSAQRPAIVIPEPPAAMAAPVAPAESRPALKVTPPPMPAAPPPAPVKNAELKLIELGQMDEPARPAPAVKASAPRPVIKAPPAPEAPAASNSLLDVGDEFEILDGFVSGSSAETVELPTASPPKHAEPVVHVEPAAAVHNSRPAPALPEHPPADQAAHTHGSTHGQAHQEHHTPAPAKSGSGRWLIAAGLGAALIGGGALVAWRSGAGHQVSEQPAAVAATSAYTPVQQAAAAQAVPAPQTPVQPPVTQSQGTAKPVSTPVVQPPVEHTPGPTPVVATKPEAPAADSGAPILPGRPQSMAVDIDVSGADVGPVGVGAAGSSGSGVSLGIVADHYADAAADAGKQLEARLGQIGFSRLLAPLRFGSVEGMEGARRTISSAAGMVGAYRSRMAALDKIYSDSAARAQKGQKATPKEMLAWDHRLPQRETAEAAQAVDLALTKVDQLYAALLAHPEVVKADASSVNFTDPDLAKQYQALKQWLTQRFDSWSTAPAEVVPPTVRQTMKAFSDAMAR
ncbi:MAG TPA: hypothetical protein VMJ30_07580 [Gemmatimonadales bacterium]|nr:hypothetical protein [Gemmatimonadales bacterium]